MKKKKTYENYGKRLKAGKRKGELGKYAGN